MNPSFGRADMHMHTNISDGASTVRELLDYISKHKQLDVIAITDHDRLAGSLWAYENQDRYPFEIVPGLEVTTREGHVLAWWVTQPIPAHMSLEETVIAIHEAGGLAILAHPFHIHVSETRKGFRRYISDMSLIQQISFDGVEVVNAGSILPGANAYARWVCHALDIAVVGNSDAHTVHGIGSASTRFPGKTSQDLKRAILNRQTQANGGIWSLKAYFAYAKGVIDGSIQYVETPIGAEVVQSDFQR